jgi:UDP-N-acetylglucosamine 2-epimerase
MIPRAVLTTAFDHALKESIRKLKPPFGDGHASERIAAILEDNF